MTLLKKSKISADAIVKDYWRNNAQFADLFNAVFFNGESIIAADSLVELDTEESSVMEHKKYAESLKGARDVLKVSKKLVDSSLQMCILGVENQELVHYAMPMRVMGYDYLAYKKQYDSNAQRYNSEEKRKKYHLTQAEYVSRMRREDKFAPIITIVLYYGEEEWDGARRLHEMLKIPPRLLPLVKDYELNLVEARNNEFVFHNKNNRDFFTLIKVLLNKNLAMKEAKKIVLDYCEENEVETSVVRTISATLDVKVNYEKVKEDGNMCTFFEELRAEGKLEGEKKQAKETAIRLKEKGFSFEDIAEVIGFSVETVKEWFGVSLV